MTRQLRRLWAYLTYAVTYLRWQASETQASLCNLKTAYDKAAEIA